MTLTVVSKPIRGGSVTIQPPSIEWRYSPVDNVTLIASAYPHDNITITAVPKPGYRFVRWTGDVDEIEDATQSSVLVPMNDYYAQNITTIQITAGFERKGLPPWVWLVAGAVALLLVALSTGLLLLRRKGHPADAEPP